MDLKSRKILFIGFIVIFVLAYFLIYQSYSYLFEAKSALSYYIQVAETTPLNEVNQELPTFSSSSSQPTIETTEALNDELLSTTMTTTSTAAKTSTSNITTVDTISKASGGDFLSGISKSRPLRVWTMDIHVGTRSEMSSVFKNLLGLPTVVVAGPHKDISRAIGNKEELRKICPHPHVQRRRFFEVYHTKKEIRQADLLYHEMRPGNTEFLMPLNKSILMYLATNHEFGRENPIQIREWYLNLRRLAADPRSAIVANNRYQQRSLLYYTGVNATFIPSVSLYTNAQYDNKPVHKDVAIIGGNHPPTFAPEIINRTNKILSEKGSKMKLVYIRELMPIYKYSDLVKFPCMVHFPYTVSSMSQIEAYNMGIPSFYPSLDYLVKLEGDEFAKHEHPYSYRVYWFGLPILRGGPFVEKDCKLPAACSNPGLKNATAEERKAWWQLSDFYHWKNVIYYDSPEDLAEKLTTTNFVEVSKKILEEVEETRAKAKRDWRELFDRILNPMPPEGYQMPSDYYLAMQERWNVTKSELDESEELEGPACDMYQESGIIPRPGPEFVKK